MLSQYGRAEVYVASDSDAVLEGLQAAATDIQWRFLPNVNRSQVPPGHCRAVPPSSDVCSVLASTGRCEVCIALCCAVL